MVQGSPSLNTGIVKIFKNIKFSDLSWNIEVDIFNLSTCLIEVQFQGFTQYNYVAKLQDELTHGFSKIVLIFLTSYRSQQERVLISPDP